MRQSDPTIGGRLNDLAELATATSRFTEAERFSGRASRIDEARPTADLPDHAVVLDHCAGRLDALDRPDEATALRSRAQVMPDARAAARVERYIGRCRHSPGEPAGFTSHGVPGRGGERRGAGRLIQPCAMQPRTPGPLGPMIPAVHW